MMAAALTSATGTIPHARADTLQPPQLSHYVPAAYPNTERGAARVVLELLISAAGAVDHAKVVTAAAPAFDAAALSAAGQLRFSPARRDGVPLPARLHFAYVFVDPAASSEAAPAASARPGGGRDDDGAATSPGAATASSAASGSAATDTAADDRAAAEPELGTPIFGARGRVLSDAARLNRSARAITAIDMGDAGRESADLGEVLRRSEGIAVQSEGGLGARTRVSLAGLGDARVPVFLDGLPLSLSGHPFGLANVPLSLVRRVDIYRGVLPIRLGTDALGGAIELVSDADLSRSRAAASVQLGSFDTRRAYADALYRSPAGFYVGLAGFADHADNDYQSALPVPDADGRARVSQARRFHDAYDAHGLRLAAGIEGAALSDKLGVHAFVSDHRRELQHNLTAETVYGEPTFGKRSLGGDLHYEKALGPVRLSARLLLARIRSDFEDLSHCRYNGLGVCVVERLQAGETPAGPADSTLFEHALVGRVRVDYRVSEQHALRLSLAPGWHKRVGQNRALPADSYDALNARRRVQQLVSGIEYEGAHFAGRFSHIAFAKHYLFEARSEEALPSGIVQPLDNRAGRLGAGDSARLRVTEHLWLKASYEYATRLPGTDELFGDGGATVVANPHLRPEVSHNGNVGLGLSELSTPLGVVGAHLRGLVREVDRMIIPQNAGGVLQYANLMSARIWGIEGGAGIRTLRKHLSLSGTLSYQDARNRSERGQLAEQRGARLPNRPFLQAFFGAELRRQGVFFERDLVSLHYRGRYVHPFYFGWEALGPEDAKLRVPAQCIHALSLTLHAPAGAGGLSVSAEVQNLADARAFDLFGVQRPGRAFYVKTAFEL